VKYVNTTADQQGRAQQCPTIGYIALNQKAKARNSTFTHKGSAVDVTRVAKELVVRYMVEGGVRKAGNKVRITAQLT
jgi:hypothetical protein